MVSEGTPPMAHHIDAVVNSMRIGAGCLSDFLFPDSKGSFIDKWVESTREQAKAKLAKLAESSARPSKAPKKENDRWETDHMMAFNDEGRPWPPSLDVPDPLFPNAAAVLPKRMQECAYFYSFIAKETMSIDEESVHDLNVNLDASGGQPAPRPQRPPSTLPWPLAFVQRKGPRQVPIVGRSLVSGQLYPSSLAHRFPPTPVQSSLSLSLSLSLSKAPFRTFPVDPSEELEGGFHALIRSAGLLP